MSLVNNEVQFLTLDFLKNHFQITDNQDDDTLLGIVQACNMEMKKSISGTVDNIAKLKETQFWASIQSTALIYCESEIRRQINQLYTQAIEIMKRFKESVISLIDEIRSTAPERTERNIAARDSDFEDDFFAERRFV